MKKENPLVTIGIPIHNGADSINSLFESLLNQTYNNF